MPCRSSSESVLRAPATTCAPSAASSRATARPMPLLAPVTTATLPVSSRSIGGPYARLERPATPGGAMHGDIAHDVVASCFSLARGEEWVHQDESAPDSDRRSPRAAARRP